MEALVSKRRQLTVKAKGPSGVRKAPILSTARRPRSVAKRSQRKAKRGVKKQRGLLLPHSQCLILLHQTPRRTIRCVLHRGAESQRATRFVALHAQHPSRDLGVLYSCFAQILSTLSINTTSKMHLKNTCHCFSGKLGPV